ncbi:MAG: ABC transporter substrate-binding protein [Candidatus Rokubacteria bacterium]|nr:ABC transporter substrate-binding protein [Candidatus Rokubacteria bacterium]MBI2494262.1 ABC transporter substrate-binding protein [Candidatus Rokubacteria bacterium]
MNGARIALALLVLLLLPAVAVAAPAGKLVIAQGVDPTTLDPQWHEETPAYNVLLNIYDTLLFRDTNLKIIPWLAESWKLVNPTTWEFKIRKGVKFHNGEDVDADAVKFSLDRIRGPELKGRQAGYFRLVTSVDVVDKHTVRVVTAKPYPTLENHLALRGHVMPPKHFRGRDKVFADRNPVGSGPYRFVRWAKDEAIELEADPGWWGGAPKVKTLVFRPIPEHAVRVAALQAGEIDVAVNIPPHLIAVIEKHPRLYVSKAPSVRPIFIPLYTHQFDSANKPVGAVEGPTRDKRVRQAMLAALNVDEIVKTVLEGNAIRTATPLTSKHFGFDRTLAPVKLDADRAKKLLADAGFPQGIDLTLNSPDGRYLKDKEVAEAVAGQLTRAGIRTRVKTHEWTTYLTQLVYPHKANPMYLIGWGNTTWDADGTLFPLFRSGNPQSNYYSPDFDGMIDEAQTSVDPKRRLELYARAQRLMLDDGAVLPLYQQMDIYGVNKRASFQALSSEQLVGVWMSLRDGK